MSLKETKKLNAEFSAVLHKQWDIFCSINDRYLTWDKRILEEYLNKRNTSRKELKE
ncbi:hypothetical protein J7Q84_04550 [Bacillus sp. 165]|nr:hypothetical protein [Bacillus sp. 165]